MLKQIDVTQIKRRRVAAGVRLIELAVAARCSPATVRCWEHGMTVRPEIAQRLETAHAELCAKASARARKRGADRDASEAQAS